jgi:hypothetical protein
LYDGYTASAVCRLAVLAQKHCSTPLKLIYKLRVNKTVHQRR